MKGSWWCASAPVLLLRQCVFGYALGIDLTKRDVQAKAKSMRRPWEESKAFDHSAPISPVYPLREPLPWATSLLRLMVNGEVRQESTLDKMIWPVAAIIRYIAERNEIAAGDLIYTGTPAGVGPLRVGDLCRVQLVKKDDTAVPVLPGVECSLRFAQ
ncbi:Palmitoyltransferase zdhhc15, variant 4 [Perkinsus olseni]|uniref:Palmitoyltransferase zdhhc15, variant 4 n=1 Tax=Perkinsus olseni TaxID=32597 RepID=A0A7J6QX41_PEROL|nr:Palmitoyltransferase zdhhc15, variant 4 [Perkinsus olseni]